MKTWEGNTLPPVLFCPRCIPHRRNSNSTSTSVPPHTAAMSSLAHLNDAEEKAKMLRGELYHAFVPSLVAERARCSAACHALNTASGPTRLERANLWNA